MSRTYPSIDNTFESFNADGLGVADGDILYSSIDIPLTNYHAFVVVGSGSIEIEGTLNRINWVPVAIRIASDITPNTVSAHLHDNEMGVIQGKFLRLRAIKHGDVSIHGFHGWD